MMVGSRRRSWARRSIYAVVSLTLHIAAIVGLVSAQPSLPDTAPVVPITVLLVDAPRHEPVALPAPKEKAQSPAVPAATLLKVRPTQEAPRTIPMASATIPSAGIGAELGSAELAGATSVGSGPPGGVCDMGQRLQAALRRDRMVLRAAAAIGEKTVLVWRGDWVQGQGEDGLGLAVVREAIMWEIAFAPPACRNQLAHGLILISLGASPGGPQLALGTANWRWSDLLGSR